MKPEDVPQRFWDAADHLIIALEEHVDFSNDGRIQQDRMDEQYARTQAVIARAIIAAKAEEREACAEFCSNQAPRVVGELFAAAIRQRGETD